MSPHSNRNQVLGHMTSMTYKPRRAIWSGDTGQRLPCFDRCQLTITWMSNIKEVRCKQKLGISWSMAAMLRGVGVVVVGCTRPLSMLLTMLTMKKELRWFLFLCIHVVLFL